ncbi:hypothetical protein [Litorilituus lipolyticus]|uniref:Uncharacterized protein n=1 Tax=Litorilituus lipolyticus TaxID=2491017 RepID=A0A502L716_9GAMM|nr:hypothetical protein [Litorilituus lipolyticus]TPH18161.1 hypothetical protein EPA86_03350 [Litorilituus lipolyticus]
MPDNQKMSVDELEQFANQLSERVDDEVESEVPHWNRAAAFEQCFHEQEAKDSLFSWRWWQMPTMSAAFSLAMVALVLSWSNASPTDADLTAMIHQQVNEQVEKRLAVEVNAQVEQLVSLRLREYAAEQQVVLANYRADIYKSQQSNNLELASYILTASREERKDDMTDFISFINAQRKDEQLAQKIKFQQLEREIGFQKVNLKATEHDGYPLSPSSKNTEKQQPLNEDI